MTKTLTSLKLGTALAALAAFAAPASAQDEPLPVASIDQADLEAATQEDEANVVVTARRREENLIDVPIAVTAYSGEALERRGASDITDLNDTTPTYGWRVARHQHTLPPQSARRPADPLPVLGARPHLDDVYLNRPRRGARHLRLERSSASRPRAPLWAQHDAARSIFTRRLCDEPDLRLRGIRTDGQLGLIVSGSTPLSDQIRIGASAARLGRDGFGENLNNGLDNYNRDVWAARGTIELEPAHNVFIRFTGDYSRENSDPRNGHRLTPGLLSGAPV